MSRLSDPAEDWVEILKLYGGRCWICGALWEHKEGDTTFPELPSDEWIVAEESVASGEPSVTYQTLVRANNHTASVAKELRQS